MKLKFVGSAVPAKIRELHKLGLSISDICKKLNCKYYTVYNYINSSSSKSPLKKYHNKIEKLLFDDGVSVSEVARIINCSYNSIYAYIKYHFNWDKSKKKECHNLNYNKKRKCKLTNEQIFKEFEEHHSVSMIVQKAGVTRQLISKLLIDHGYDPMKYHKIEQAKQKIETKKKRDEDRLINIEKRNQKKLLKQEQFELKWKPIIEAWPNITINEICDRLNMPIGSVSWYMGKFRKKGLLPPKRNFTLT